MFTDQELGNIFDGFENKDGMTKAQFMAEVKRQLDPTRNSAILDEMIDMRHKGRVARENKRMIDKAREKSRLGLR